MDKRCLRCGGDLENVTVDGVKGILFLSCTCCPCQYKENSAGRLCDRWLMPITLPLYMVIYEKDPMTQIDEVVNQMLSREDNFLNILIEHINEEINHPKQKLTDIHDFSFPNEEKLREFLCMLEYRLVSKRKKKISIAFWSSLMRLRSNLFFR